MTSTHATITLGEPLLKESVISESHRFPIGARKVLLGFLVGMFTLQTWLVYGDDTGRASQPLSSEAFAGRAVWLRYNCQSCHQFYGFGGFLGPDLTNASARLDRPRLDAILTDGSGQMPAFNLSPDEITSVAAFLREIDRTGVGQARAPTPDPQVYAATLASLIDDGVLTGSSARGARRYLDGTCPACHVPFAAKRIGAFLASDLSNSVSQLGDEDILATLIGGRPELGMPPTGLDPVARAEILAFLRWQAESRNRLLEQTEGDVSGLPWFEFR